MTEAPPKTPEQSRARFERVVVLAEDLIWATRLSSLVKRAGVEVKQAKTDRELDSTLAFVDAVIVDLTARNYDGIAAVEHARGQGREVVCVGQHEDTALRGRAMAAGAARVWTYNQVHAHGATLIGRWVTGG